ncbi:hypothetical protein DRQ09_09215 [candidate division KSB1 bacterium]|nr:MAG: hypothetical protein DRQ09_09215 [candidate division KSB1 bacterium]
MTPPEKVLGFSVGADYHLATYEQAIKYLKVLEKESGRIKLFEIGKTSMGKPMIYAVISSEENIMNLEKYRSISERLSLVRVKNENEALNLAKKGKAIVYIDGGLHATECAPAQHNIQLAYDLVSGESERIKKILDNVILVLVFANPDGMDIVADWYSKNLGTPYEVSPLPWLYHKYVGHDNNRDSYMVNQIETKNLTKIVNKIWFPHILYNHHQTAPFPARIWIPPNSEPTNPNVHPLVVRWQNIIGSAMGKAFDEEGKEGAISRIVFDSWYPGYVTQVVDGHNIASILTETALYRYATPHFYTVRDFPESYRDFTIAAFYPNPWKGGWWRLKDAVDYCLTASKAVLDVASKYRKELLFDKYKMGVDVINRFKKEPPYAWIIPEKQWDPVVMSTLLNKMILLAIDVYRANENFTVDGVDYPKGTYVIPMTQPFALFVKNIFEEQKYPDLRKYPALWQGLVGMVPFKGAPLRSYDAEGWTLPYQMGVKVVPANSPLKVDMYPVSKVVPPEGFVKGNPDYAYLICHKLNNSFIATNRIIKKGGKVLWAKKSFKYGKKEFPAGTIIVPANKISREFMENLAKELHLKITGIENSVDVPVYKLKPLKLGLYKSWVASADEGWTRWLFEQYEFPYSSIYDGEIRAGSLNKRFDVIVLPSISPGRIVNGHTLGTMPPKYVGGITKNGVENLKTFVKQGGTIITIGSSCNFILQYFNVPVTNVLSGVKRNEFICSGSLLKVEFDTKHPVAYGMPKEAAGFFSYSPVFNIIPSFSKEMKPEVIARYPKENLLMSGWIYGDRFIRRKPAIVEVPYRKGKIILIGFKVQNRGQPHGTFKLLFNALYYGTVESVKN